MRRFNRILTLAFAAGAMSACNDITGILDPEPAVEKFIAAGQAFWENAGYQNLEQLGPPLHPERNVYDVSFSGVRDSYTYRLGTRCRNDNSDGVGIQCMQRSLP